MKRPCRPGLALLLALLPACSQELEVRGAVGRVVGEKVTLALVEGEDRFNGELSLRASDGSLLSGAALTPLKPDERTVSFLIPTGVPSGPATVLAGRVEGERFQVPLHINRLALVLDDKGAVEAWPLSPASLPRLVVSSTALSPAFVSVSPSGGEVAVVSGDEVRLLALGPEVRDLGASVKQPAISAAAAVPGGRVLVATDQSLILFRFARGQQTTQEAITFKEVRALAVATSGETALVLHGCDTNSDGTLDAACLVQISLQPALSEVTGSRVTLAAAPTASVLTASRDGNGAIVADGTGIHGVFFAGPPPAAPRQATIPWTHQGTPFTGQPVAADRAPAIVSGQAVDLLAVAEQSDRAVYLLAFNPAAGNDLQVISSVQLTEAPTRISFGRRTQLYVAAGKALFTFDAGLSSPAVSAVAEVTPANPIASLVVQP